MRTRHLILLLLNDSGGKIDSKTKLQKEMYFVSLLLNKDLNFKAHYYGPYSLKVEQGLDELIGAGFIGVTRDIWGIENRYGFELKRYSFHLTKSGEMLAGILTKMNSDENQKIKEFVEKLNEMGNPDYISLSIAAKAFFILNREEENLTRDQIIKKSKKFGWAIDV
ncbi:MAG: hypothetical protein AB1546_16330, partial [bacterium]